MQHEKEPTEPKTAKGSKDAGLGLDLFGKPITVADVEAAKAAQRKAAKAAEREAEEYDQPGQNQDFGLTLNADEWEMIEEVWDEIDAQIREDRIAKQAKESR